MSRFTTEERADIFAESRAILEQRNGHADAKPLPPVCERPVEIEFEDELTKYRRFDREQKEREAAHKAECKATRDVAAATQQRHDLAVAEAYGAAANPFTDVDVPELLQAINEAFDNLA